MCYVSEPHCHNDELSRYYQVQEDQCVMLVNLTVVMMIESISSGKGRSMCYVSEPHCHNDELSRYHHIKEDQCVISVKLTVTMH